MSLCERSVARDALARNRLTSSDPHSILGRADSMVSSPAIG
jgi:hypothetical protein